MLTLTHIDDDDTTRETRHTKAESEGMEGNVVVRCLMRHTLMRHSWTN